MLYRYEPNCHIIDYGNMKEKFCFDENGIFKTEDPKLIDWIKKNKNFIPCEETPAAAVTLFKCKKCDFETEDKKILTVHYKENHPKTLRVPDNPAVQIELNPEKIMTPETPAIIGTVGDIAPADPPHVTMYHCKKCNFSTDNKGLLLAHYKEAHPKEG